MRVHIWGEEKTYSRRSRSSGRAFSSQVKAKRRRQLGGWRKLAPGLTTLDPTHLTQGNTVPRSSQL